MGNVKIGRYADPVTAEEWAGYIEADDRSWIIWLDGNGKPALYFSERDANGGVIGLGIRLDGDVPAE